MMTGQKWLETTVEEGQNLTDLAVQCYGSVEGLLLLLLDNYGIRNLDSQLAPGTIIRYRQLPPPEIAGTLPATKAVQDLYHNRRMRVRTGADTYVPTAPCPIPEGYVMFQFSIEAITRNTVLYIDVLGQGCPLPEYFDANLSELALVNSTSGTNTQAAAMETAWFINNSYLSSTDYGCFAVSTRNIITMYIPLSVAGCDARVNICAYKQKGYAGEEEVSFEPADPAPEFNFHVPVNPNSGQTVCCGGAVTGGEFDADNQWMTDAVF